MSEKLPTYDPETDSLVTTTELSEKHWALLREAASTQLQPLVGDNSIPLIKELEAAKLIVLDLQSFTPTWRITAHGRRVRSKRDTRKESPAMVTISRAEASINNILSKAESALIQTLEDLGHEVGNCSMSLRHEDQAYVAARVQFQAEDPDMGWEELRDKLIQDLTIDPELLWLTRETEGDDWTLALGFFD